MEDIDVDNLDVVTNVCNVLENKIDLINIISDED